MDAYKHIYEHTNTHFWKTISGNQESAHSRPLGGYGHSPGLKIFALAIDVLLTIVELTQCQP